MFYFPFKEADVKNVTSGMKIEYDTLTTGFVCFLELLLLL